MLTALPRACFTKSAEPSLLSLGRPPAIDALLGLLRLRVAEREPDRELRLAVRSEILRLESAFGRTWGVRVEVFEWALRSARRAMRRSGDPERDPDTVAAARLLFFIGRIDGFRSAAPVTRPTRSDAGGPPLLAAWRAGVDLGRSERASVEGAPEALAALRARAREVLATGLEPGPLAERLRRVLYGELRGRGLLDAAADEPYEAIEARWRMWAPIIDTLVETAVRLRVRAEGWRPAGTESGLADRIIRSEAALAEAARRRPGSEAGAAALRTRTAELDPVRFIAPRTVGPGAPREAVAMGETVERWLKGIGAPAGPVPRGLTAAVWYWAAGWLAGERAGGSPRGAVGFMDVVDRIRVTRRLLALPQEDGPGQWAQWLRLGALEGLQARLSPGVVQSLEPALRFRLRAELADVAHCSTRGAEGVLEGAALHLREADPAVIAWGALLRRRLLARARATIRIGGGPRSARTTAALATLPAAVGRLFEEAQALEVSAGPVAAGA